MALKSNRAVRLIPIGETAGYPSPSQDEEDAYTALRNSESISGTSESARAAREYPQGRKAAVIAQSLIAAAANYR